MFSHYSNENAFLLRHDFDITGFMTRTQKMFFETHNNIISIIIMIIYKADFIFKTLNDCLFKKLIIRISIFILLTTFRRSVISKVI